MNTADIGIGIIGFGYWGQNIVRNFLDTPGCRIVAVADSSETALGDLRRLHPSLKAADGASAILEDPAIHAVVIATPVSTHYELARQAVLNGKHVLVEKPMTTSVEQARDLIALATRNKLVLAVDHTFLYTGAVRKMKELIDEGVIGAPKYFDSTRINLGLFQPDVNVLWDLASHDIAILLYLVGQQPKSVNATGISHTGNGIENIAYLTLNYTGGFIAHIHCSWTSPVKIRQTLIGGDRQMIIYNDLEPTEKIRLYDTSYNLVTEEDKRKVLVDYRTGNITIPRIVYREALGLLARDFIDCIIGAGRPLSGADLGLRVVEVLAAAQVSIKENGREVMIDLSSK